MHRRLLPMAVGLSVLLFLSSSSYCAIQPEQVVWAKSVELRVGTYNVLTEYSRNGESWDLRRSYVMDIIRTNAPDLLAIEEASPRQLQDLTSALPCFGVVDGNSGFQEYGPPVIFYRAERFIVRSQARVWLSPYPNVPDSVGWGNQTPRCFTVAVLWDKLKNRRLMVVAVHLDHMSSVSRTTSVKFLASWIRHHKGSPLIVMGDFNDDPSASKLLRTLVTNDYPTAKSTSKLVDVAAVNTYAPKETFNSLGHKVRNGRIDLILFSWDWGVTSVKVDQSRPNGRYPSDHDPVFATLYWDRDPSLWGQRRTSPLTASHTSHALR